METTPGLPHRHQKDLLVAIKRICLIFWGPGPADCAEMKAGSFFLPFENLKPAMTGEFADPLQKIKAFSEDFSDADLLCRQLEETFVRLFVNAKGGIQAPLYQSCYEYENAPLMGASAVKMKKRFEASGLTLAENITEPPDHLCIELEYLYFLLDKSGSRPKRSVLYEAGSFAAETMLPWVSVFAGRLQQETDCRFYPLAARLLVLILDWVAGFGGGKLRERG